MAEETNEMNTRLEEIRDVLESLEETINNKFEELILAIKEKK
ncbi:MAG: hypothetical protein Q8N63_03180 [Nanoarchaeota archaeon]|nr:hypothetical protein [Nanoarchaeota archaeon]